MTFDPSKIDLGFIGLSDPATRRVRISIIKLEAQRVTKTINAIGCLRHIFNAIASEVFTAQPREFANYLESDLPEIVFKAGMLFGWIVIEPEPKQRRVVQSSWLSRH